MTRHSSTFPAAQTRLAVTYVKLQAFSFPRTRAEAARRHGAWKPRRAKLSTMDTTSRAPIELRAVPAHEQVAASPVLASIDTAQASSRTTVRSSRWRISSEAAHAQPSPHKLVSGCASRGCRWGHLRHMGRRFAGISRGCSARLPPLLRPSAGGST